MSGQGEIVQEAKHRFRGVQGSCLDYPELEPVIVIFNDDTFEVHNLWECHFQM